MSQDASPAQAEKAGFQVQGRCLNACERFVGSGKAAYGTCGKYLIAAYSAEVEYSSIAYPNGGVESNVPPALASELVAVDERNVAKFDACATEANSRRAQRPPPGGAVVPGYVPAVPGGYDPCQNPDSWKLAQCASKPRTLPTLLPMRPIAAPEPTACTFSLGDTRLSANAVEITMIDAATARRLIAAARTSVVDWDPYFAKLGADTFAAWKRETGTRAYTLGYTNATFVVSKERAVGDVRTYGIGETEARAALASIAPPPFPGCSRLTAVSVR